MTETHAHDPKTSKQDENATSGISTPPTASAHQMDGRMMWVMMIGCCLAIPLALIIGGAGLGSLAGASNWLIGAGVVLAVALVITRRISRGPDCEPPSEP